MQEALTNLTSVNYVTDSQGRRTGVLLDMEVWQTLLARLGEKLPVQADPTRGGGDSDIMSLAGGWDDMPAEDFDDFLEEIASRRQQGTGKRRRAASLD